MTQRTYLISQIAMFGGILLFGGILGFVLALAGAATNAYMLYQTLENKKIDNSPE